MQEITMITNFVMALAVLIATIIGFIKNENIRKTVESKAFIIAISGFVQMLLLTLGIANTSKHDASDVLHAIGATIKAMGGEVNTSFVDELTIFNVFHIIYCVWLYILWFVTPVAAGGVLISTLNKINTLFIKTTIRKKNVFIFTELTPETLVTANTRFEAIMDKNAKKQSLFIFLKGEKEVLRNESIPAKLITDKLSDIIISTGKVENIEIWDFCLDGVVRTSEIIDFINKYENVNDQLQVSANIFDSDEVSLERYKKLIDHYAKNPNINILLSDTYKHSVQHVLRTYPLYDYVKEDAKEINILLVGMGEFGYHFIVSIFGSCHFLNSEKKPVKLRITAVDCIADEICNKRYIQSPDFLSTLKHEGVLETHNCNVESPEFARLLDRKKNINYCVIATNNDETNIKIAKFLKVYFTRRIVHKFATENKPLPADNNVIFHMLPSINVKIRDGEKSEYIFKDEKGKKEFERVNPFGSVKVMYDYQVLSTNEIKGISKKLHTINWYSSGLTGKENFDLLVKIYNKHLVDCTNQYEIDNTNEEAICLRYLIHGCSHPDKKAILSCIDGKTDNVTFGNEDYYFTDEPSVKSELEALAGLLHERWRYYTLYLAESLPCEQDYNAYEELNTRREKTEIRRYKSATAHTVASLKEKFSIEKQKSRYQKSRDEYIREQEKNNSKNSPLAKIKEFIRRLFGHKRYSASVSSDNQRLLKLLFYRRMKKLHKFLKERFKMPSVHKYKPAKYNNLLRPASQLPNKSLCDYAKVKLMTYIVKP